MILIIFIFITPQILASHLGIVSENNQRASIDFSYQTDIYSLSVQSGQKILFYALNHIQTRELEIQINDEQILSYNNSIIFSPIDLLISNDLMINDFSDRITFQDQDQNILWVFEDFGQYPDGWSDKRQTSCGTSQNLFLGKPSMIKLNYLFLLKKKYNPKGGPCNFGKQIISKQFHKIPKHQKVINNLKYKKLSFKLIINFIYHFFDDWDGETAQLVADGELVWDQSYRWCEKVMPWMCYKFGINSCGNDIPDQIGQYVEVILQHSLDNILLEFSTSLEKDACQASWGIDNLQIYLQ